jgi:hypothetical protein
MSSIDYASPALGPVRAMVEAQIVATTAKVVNPRTPLDEVPTYRGEIAALNWLLTQLKKPSEMTHE